MLLVLDAARVCCCTVADADADADAASTTTALLAFLRLVTLRTGMIIIELSIATTTTTTTTITTTYLSPSYAVSSPGKQPSRAASGGKLTTGAVDLLAVGGCDPRESGVCCWCLLLQCCCWCFDDDCLPFYVWSHFVLAWPYYYYCYSISRHGIGVTLYAWVYR